MYCFIGAKSRRASRLAMQAKMNNTETQIEYLDQFLSHRCLFAQLRDVAISTRLNIKNLCLRGIKLPLWIWTVARY